jgi:hypothetical protein
MTSDYKEAIDQFYTQPGHRFPDVHLAKSNNCPQFHDTCECPAGFTTASCQAVKDELAAMANNNVKVTYVELRNSLEQVARKRDPATARQLLVCYAGRQKLEFVAPDRFLPLYAACSVTLRGSNENAAPSQPVVKDLPATPPPVKDVPAAVPVKDPVPVVPSTGSTLYHFIYIRLEENMPTERIVKQAGNCGWKGVSDALVNDLRIAHYERTKAVKPIIDTRPEYNSLFVVLMDAYDQAANGKGAARHNLSGEIPFERQRMQLISELIDSPKGMEYQAVKKLTEGMAMQNKGACIRELLGAVNYIAGMVVYLRKKHANELGDE